MNKGIIILCVSELCDRQRKISKIIQWSVNCKTLTALCQVTEASGAVPDFAWADVCSNFHPCVQQRPGVKHAQDQGS